MNFMENIQALWESHLGESNILVKAVIILAFLLSLF